jgi:hypothetical protein
MMSPALRAWMMNAIAIPQLALWATNIIARVAGLIVDA